MDRGSLVYDEIMRLGLSLGGTCTGEHGVGLLTWDWLAREIGPVGIRQPPSRLEPWAERTLAVTETETETETR